MIIQPIRLRQEKDGIVIDREPEILILNIRLETNSKDYAKIHFYNHEEDTIYY